MVKKGDGDMDKFCLGNQGLWTWGDKDSQGKVSNPRESFPLEVKVLGEDTGLPAASMMEDVKEKGNSGAWVTWGRLVYVSFAMK